MSLIKAEIETVRLKMRVDRTRVIKQGYPWIYSDWLTETPDVPRGSRAMVRDRDGKLLAFGFYDPDSSLAVRVCAIEREQLDDNLIVDRLKSSVARRAAIHSSSTNGYRLINGEGDLLPGLVCDRYNEYAVLKLDGSSPEAFWGVVDIAALLMEVVSLKGVYQRSRGSEQAIGRWLCGTSESPRIPFKENDILFTADISVGQKTGFFFDQRDNRSRIRRLAKNRHVLNLFGYTGGFSAYAGVGGASHVTTVDLAKPAIAASIEHWRMNALAAAQHEGIAADAFEFLAQAAEASRSWDLIIVDPPSFASSQKQVDKATESYTKLFAMSLACLGEQGAIALSSCSSHVGMSQFMEIIQAACSKARRRTSVIGVYGQPPDHPFPLVCSDLQYLKFVLLQAH